MKALPLFCLFVLSGALPSGAQSADFAKLESEMRLLVQRVLRDTAQEARLQAHEDLQNKLEQTLALPNSYAYAFDIEGMSILQPEDKALRFFTWQLYVDKDKYLYGGFLQLKDGTVHRLSDESDGMRAPQYDRLAPKDWYGALYYALQPFKGPENQTMYLLFGYDMYSFFHRRKVLDVFYIDAGGKPRFGAPVIEVKDAFGKLRTVHRMILEYSASVAVGLRYNAQKDMVVYDHLVLSNHIREAGPSNIPDGSYEGLKLEKGVWKYVSEVFTENPYYGNDNPPMPEPKFDSKKKERDILGREGVRGKRWVRESQG